MARRSELGSSRAEGQFNRLQLERKQIEDRASFLAWNYHAVFKEEGAIYPDGWIGKYLKQMGFVVRKGPPVYPQDL